MRRITAALVGALLLLPLGTQIANATKPERYSSQVFNAYWNHRRKIDNHKFRLSQWYTGVYSSGEDFWSDLYKSVSVCTHDDNGRQRCKSKSYWYGAIQDLGSGSFSVDQKLESWSLDATYPLEDARTEEPLGDTTVSVQLTGVGSITKYSDRETYQDGCNTFRYSSRSEQRGAEATGTYRIAGQDGKNFGRTTDAFMSQGSNLQSSKTC